MYGGELYIRCRVRRGTVVVGVGRGPGAATTLDGAPTSILRAGHAHKDVEVN